MSMKFGIALPNFGRLASSETINRISSEAESLGYHSLWVAERLLVPEPPNQSWSKRSPTAFEPLITLSHIASRTSSIRIGTQVLILPVRNPVLLARATASLDVISQGRLDLGIGIGWMKEEMQVSNVNYDDRGKISDDYIESLRDLWQGKAHEGRFIKVPAHNFQPRPVKGSIPIWVGGNSDAALNRVASLGDGWLPMGQLDPGDLSKKIGKIREFAEDSGRDADVISISCNYTFSMDEMKDGSAIDIVEKYLSRGVTHMIPRFEFENVDEMVASMRQFARKVVPSF